jgi:glycosyltransferase involved in cell wall biosynthesis
MTNYRYIFTVFTASYNRAHTLHRVYESLRVQTFRDFEWLVVDDGSTDATGELLKKWQAEANFPFRYIYQQNQGKPGAFNRGVQEAQGELFLNLDSDDGCVPNALERLKFHWDGIPAGEKDKFSAVTALCKDQNDKLCGDKFPRDIWDSDSIEYTFDYAIRGEKWGFQRTDVLKQFPYPMVPDVKFIPESVVWLPLSRKFKTRFVNEILRIYHVDDGAKDHLVSLTASTMAGRLFFYKFVLNEYTDRLFRSPRYLFRATVNFSRYSFGLGKGPWSQFKELRPTAARLLAAAALPLGFAISLKDKRNMAR